MKVEYAKCGFACSKCTSYKENLKTKKDRQRCSDGWFRYFGFRLTPEKLRRCDGCQTEKKDANRYLNCVIRKCAMRNGIETCAHCAEYENCLKKHGVISCHFTRENVEGLLGEKVPEKEYRTFIEPFENCRHLEEIRRTLRTDEIVRPKELATRTVIVDFPAGAKVSNIERQGLRKLHKVLSSIIAIRGKTYAQHEILNRKRARYFLRLLWIAGLYGEYRTSGGAHLVLDAAIHEGEKLEGNYSRIKKYLDMIKKYGVKAEIVILQKGVEGKKRMLTPMGWLRGEGWKMRIAFTEKVGGKPLLKLLQKYVRALNRSYGKNAFAKFLKADMTVFSRKGR